VPLMSSKSGQPSPIGPSPGIVAQENPVRLYVPLCKFNQLSAEIGWERHNPVCFLLRESQETRMRKGAIALAVSLVGLPDSIDDLQLSPVEQRGDVVPFQYQYVIVMHDSSPILSCHRREIISKCASTHSSE